MPKKSVNSGFVSYMYAITLPQEISSRNLIEMKQFSTLQSVSPPPQGERKGSWCDLQCPLTPLSFSLNFLYTKSFLSLSYLPLTLSSWLQFHPAASHNQKSVAARGDASGGGVTPASDQLGQICNLKKGGAIHILLTMDKEHNFFQRCITDCQEL